MQRPLTSGHFRRQTERHERKRMKVNEKEQPTLSHAEKTAADITGEGGDKRERRLRELDHIAKQREADTEILKALLAELSGDPSGKAEIAQRQARIEAADAERRQVLDALLMEQSSAEAAYAQGVEALRELGEEKPHAVMRDSAQGREIAGRASHLRRAVENAGGGHQPHESVVKAMRERVLKRSSAFDAFNEKVESVAKALDLRRPEALRKARESFAELYKAAIDAPIVMPERVSARSDVSKQKETSLRDEIVRVEKSLAEREGDLAVHLALIYRAHEIEKRAAVLKSRDGAREILEKLKSNPTHDEVLRLISEMDPKSRIELLKALGVSEAEIHAMYPDPEALQRGFEEENKARAQEVNKRVPISKPFSKRNRDGSITYADGRTVRYV